jgi:hypothetical protein
MIHNPCTAWAGLNFEILRKEGESWDTEQAQQFLEWHAGMDLRRIVFADAASEQQTLLQATQAMFDLQQLQEECSAANCRLPSAYYCLTSR